MVLSTTNEIKGIKMSQRQKVWARKARLKLVSELGGCCKSCQSEEELQFDCIVPQGPLHHRFEPSHLICFYRKESRKGNLQILCASCHEIKTTEENRKLNEATKAFLRGHNSPAQGHGNAEKEREEL